jgi:protein-S-isoprenylcysteine O-methyltransferase Ste14
MYIAATLGLAGAAIFYGSLSLSIYTASFLFAAHLFVVVYEEPTLRKSFGAEYEAYCQRIRRWVPGRTRLFHLKINR